MAKAPAKPAAQASERPPARPAPEPAQPPATLLQRLGRWARGKRDSATPETPVATVEELEPRLLYAADLNPALWATDTATAPLVAPVHLQGAHEASAETSATTAPTANNPAQPQRHEIVFIDAAVPDAERLLQGLLESRGASAVVEVVHIAAGSDALATISDVLAQEQAQGQALDAVHIVSHGAAGQLQLGGQVVDQHTLAQQANRVQGWAGALAADADLLLWGCDVGQGTAGAAFTGELARLTGADVAASTNTTGGAAQGGDWQLETASGAIESPLLQAAPASATLAAWNGTLPLALTGSETRINSNTTGNQTNNYFGRGNVAMDASGNFIAVYEDQNFTSGDILARRFNAAGTPLAAAFTVNTTTANTQDWAGVAMSSSGAFVVTWTSYDQDAAGTYGVYARLYNAAGTAVTGEILVNNGLTADNQYFPQAAMADDGSFAVVFQNAGAGLGDIVIKRYNASGTLQTTTTLSNAATENYASIAMNASGMFAVAWERDGTDGSGFGIYARLYNAAGTQIGSEVLVNSTTANAQRNPSVGIDASGNFAVAWNGYGQDTGGTWGIFARRFSSTATALGAEIAVNTTTANNETSPALAMASDGRFLVVWESDQQDSATAGIYSREFAADGSAAGAETRVNTTSAGSQFSASASFVGQRAVVTWSGNGPGDSDGVFFQLLSSPGLVTSASGGLVTTEAGGQATFTVQLATAPTANVTVAVTSGDTSEGTVSPSSLTFTPANWNVAQTVTVTGVDDAWGDGSVAYQVQLGSITSADTAYNGLAAATVGVTNTDNEAMQSIVVSTLADTTGGDTSSLAALAASRGPDGLISLREALLAANNTNNGGIAHQITFSVAGTITLGSNLPAITRPVNINGTSGGVPGIVLDGINISGNRTALALNAGSDGSTIRGLVIQYFGAGAGSQGINIGSSNNTIAGNYIGTTASGNSGATNYNGINIWGGSGNVIGGTTVADRNVISGNTNIGIVVVSAGQTIIGNYIGTNAAGNAAVANGHGIYINTAGSTVGQAGAGNLVSGNTWTGVILASAATGNVVQSNTIGLNAAGTGTLGNGAQGIEVQGANNTIGGASSAQRNVISGNSTTGVRITGAAATGNVVAGNYIGTGLAGNTDLGNGEDGLQIDTGASNNTVGGTTTSARNIIAGNSHSGVAIQDLASTGNTVLGNWIGVGSNGTTALANSHYGVWVEGTNNTIGNATEAGRNVIGFNAQSGITVNSAAVGTVIRGNWVTNNGWDGVTVQGTSSGTVLGGDTAASANLIAYNSADGILVTSTASNAATILGNNIYSNGQRGIDLGDNGVTANDSGDGDSGANGLQNFPVLTAASTTSAGTSFSGSLNSTANTNYRIDFYANRPANVDGSNGEGERWLGYTVVAIDGTGTANFGHLLSNVWINQGDRITATATRMSGASYLGTSEFSANITGTSTNVVVVDTASDTADGTTTSITNLGNARGADGRISLREAMAAANVTANGAAPDRVVFAIAPNIESGNINTALLQPTITLGSALTAMTQAVVIDGSTQPGFSSSPLVQISGNNSVALGLQLNAGSAGSTVRGLIISNFTGDGITVSSSNSNTLAGNWIGLATDGVTAAGNSDGIYVTNSSGTTIGGTSAADRNVIAGNNERGIFLSSATNSVVYGNYIGTDATGLVEVDTASGTTQTLKSGVVISGGSGNQVGGTLAGQRNVISGNNHFGVEMLASTTNNTVAGNYIGTDATGLAALGNTNGGASFWGAGTGNLLGGNTISSNRGDGVWVGSSSASANIRGNYIGVGADGATSLGNSGIGVWIYGASTNTLVGTNADGSNDAAEGNVISGNNDGIVVSDTGTTGTQIQGNYIGTDASGMLGRGNDFDGVRISGGATATSIGGSTAAKRNIIAGNGQDGIQIDGEATDGNTINGNWIGVAANGVTALGNAQDGILITSGADNTVIGGTTAAESNVIGNSGQWGIELWGATSGTLIQRNFVGTDTSGTLNFGNTLDGVAIGNGATNNTVGGTTASAANTIAFNRAGVAIWSTGTANPILGNAIYSNVQVGIDLSTTSTVNGVTANDAAPDSDTGANNLQNFPVLATARAFGTTQLILTGSLAGAANSYYRVEFFSSTSQDSTGYGEAQTYLGFVNVPTDGSGAGTINVTIAANVAVGSFISATATSSNSAYNTFTDTSELARNIAAVSSAQAVVTVDTTSDTSDGDTTSISTLMANKGADGTISLREAITAANNTANGTTADLINFAISGTGVHTITPATALPQITQAVVIDATGEDSVAANGGRPAVEIFGNGLNVHGLNLSAAADGTTIKGLSVSGFGQWGIVVASLSNSNTLQGNFIGLRADGTTASGNSIGGIQLSGSSNLIGGSTAAERNVISGNTGVGLIVMGSNNTITGNYVGTDATGMLDRGNGGVGITLDAGASGTVIGGALAAERNVISGNNSDAIYITNSATGTLVRGNYIGTAVDGVSAVGNSGAGIRANGSGASNTIGGTAAGQGNLIANQGSYGIAVSGTATGVSVLGNSLVQNTGMGIDLGANGVTANDAGDADTGANNLQNFPVLAGAITNGSSLTVNGRLNSAASSFYRIEFFASTSGDASGYGEGQTFLGFVNVATDASGNGAFATTFAVAVPAGQVISATATRATSNAYSAYTETSEFAANVVATSPVAPVNTVPGAQSTAEDTARVFSTANGNAITVGDSDAGGANNEVSLTATNGTLTLATTAGLSFAVGDGTADATMTLRGTAAAINTALNGLSFAPTANYNGGAVLTVATKDTVLLSLDIDSGLMGRYAFENTGNLGQDSSPAAGNTAATVGATSVVNGTRGLVASLDGSANSNLQINGRMGQPTDVTLAAWVNLTAADSNGSDVISLGDSLGLRLDSGGYLVGFHYNGSAHVELRYTGTLAGTGWHHVAFSFDDANNTRTLYLDGTAVAAGASSDSIPYVLGSNTTIGKHGNGSGLYDFNGLIDEARIYNRALTPNEIAVLANDLAMVDTDTVAVTVTAVNDAPSISTTGSALSFTEGDAATAIDSGVVVADVDGGNLASATVSISTGFVATQDQLLFANQAGISGSWNASTGVLTLSGSATVAQYQTALRSVQYLNISDTPNTAARTISFSASDGSATSTTAQRTLNVAAVNDAPTFSSGTGLVTTDVLGNAGDFINAMVVQPDGKTLVAGYSSINGGDIVLARYNGDGSLDSSFGGGDGLVNLDQAGGYELGQAMALLSDGRILVVGRVTSDIVLAQFNADGSVDTTFGGGDGVATAGISGGIGYGVKVQPDGKILVGGRDNSNMLVARFLSNGTLDTAFGTSGSTSIDFAGGTDIAYSMALQPDGNILLGGVAFTGSSFDAAVVRLTSSGALDTSFNGTGRVTTDIGTNSSDTGYAMALQADGKIVLSGWSDAAGNTDYFTVRYNSNGTLDTGFSGDGKVTTSFGAGNDLGQAVAVQPDGKIVVAGQTSTGSNNFGTVRYNADGTLDTTFNGTGTVDTGFGASTDDRAAAIAFQLDGRITVAGTSTLGGNHQLALARYTSAGALDTRMNLANTLGGTVAHTEGGAATVLDSNVVLFDAELGSTTYNGATLTLQRNGGANSQDVYSATSTLVTLNAGSNNLVVDGVTIGSVTTNSGGTLVLTFNSNATSALVTSAARKIAYSNSSDTPPSSVQVDWVFSDGNSGAQGGGGALAANGSVTVNITATNDAPVLASGSTLAYTENQAATAINTAITVSDVDHSTLASATVQITANYQSAADVLAFTNAGMGNIAGAWNAGTGTLTLTSASATATVSQWQAALRAVTYSNTSDAPGTAARTVSYTVNDGTSASNTVTSTVNVSAVNDAPAFVGRDGVVTTAIGTGTEAGNSVITQADGKILVAGYGLNGGNNDFALVRYNSDGTLDTSFSGDGMLFTAVGTGADLGRGVVLQPDGKILVAGSSNNGSNDDFALVRYNSDGTLDTTFSGDGMLTTAIGSGSDVAHSITLQADGKIVLAGASNNGANNDFAVVRYNSDGSLDTSFSGDGMVTTAIGSGNDTGYGVTVQADGKIVVAGSSHNGANDDFALVRYNSDGTLDTSFSGDGVLVAATGAGTDVGSSVTVQADGKILVAGSASNGVNSDIAVLRFNSDGTPDTSFSGDGVQWINVASNHDYAYSVTVQADGKIVVAGVATIALGNSDLAVARLNSDGTLDTSFSGDGIATTPIGTTHETGNSVTLQADGKILVAGFVSFAGNQDFALVRYNSDGTLDTNFDHANTLAGPVACTENGAAVVLDSNVQVFDAELSAADNFNGARLTLVRNGGANAQDDYSATGTLSALTEGGNLVVGGTTIGTVTTNSAGTLVLTFNASATQAHVNSAMQQIAYANTSEAPPASVQINWTFDDGNAGSQGSGGALTGTGNVVVNITAVNDAPVLASGSTLAYTENQASTAINTGLTVSDADNTTLASATVQITANYQSAEDVLAFTNSGMGNIAGAWNAGTGTLTLSSSGATATLAEWQAALRAVTYANSSDNPSTAARTVAYTVDDGALVSNTVNSTVNITAVNDVPVNSAPVSLALNEDQSLAVTGLSITDPDAGSSTLRTELNVSQGSLSATSGAGVTVTGSGTGQLVLTGTLTDLNAYLASAAAPVYQPAANTNGSFSLTMQTADGLNTGTGGTTASGQMDYRFHDNPAGGSDPDLLPQTGGTTGVVSGGSFASTLATNLSGSTTTYGVIYTGVLNITTAGNYTFALNADDAARYVIDGVPLSLAWFGSASDTVTLAAGRHSLELRYTQGAGGWSLGHTISGPDTSGATQNIFAFAGMGRLVSGLATTTLNVAAVNDAPTIADGTALGLSDTDEDTTSFPVAVNTLLAAAGWADPDSGAAQGLAVTGVVGTGNWQFSTDGSTWTNVGTVNATQALLLDAGSSLRYVPAGTNAETASFSFRAWDTTTGTASTFGTPRTANPGAGGGSTAYSSGSATASRNVTAVNDAPVLADTALALTVAEDAGLPSGAVGSLVSAFTAGISDVDSGAVKGVAITGTIETNGTWYYSTDGGTNWAAVGAVSNTSALLLADDASTRLYFAPAANVAGTQAGALTLCAWDQTSGSAGSKVTTASTGGTTAFSSATDTVDVAITAVNDAPVNTLPGTQTTPVSTPLVLVGATAISVADVDAATLQVTLGITHGSLTLAGTAGLVFTTGDGTADTAMVFSGTASAINAALDGMSFTPTGGYQGTASLSITTSDLGSSGSGGTLTDSDTLDLVVGALQFQQGVAGYAGTADTYVSGGTPSTDHGSASPVLVDDNVAGEAILLRFDSLFGSGVGLIPAGSTITSASLSFYVTHTDSADSVSVHSMLGAWTEASTYNSLATGVQANGTEAAVAALATLDAGVGGWVTVGGLSTLVQGWANGGTNNGFAFLTTNADGWAFASSEHGTVALRPYMSINYTPPQPAVVATSGGSAAFTENGAAVAVDPGLVLTDADSSQLTGASVSITTGFVPGQDTLSFSNQSGISGSWNAGTGELTLSGTATVAQYQAALRSITFSNSSEAPSTATRTVSFSVQDTWVAGGSDTRTVSVAAVNDAPVITSNAGGATAAVSVAETTSAVTTVTSTDVDGGTAVYSLVASGDHAAFTINSSTGALSFTTPPDYEAPTDGNGDNIYQVTVQVSDGNGGTDTQALTVTVTDVSSALVVTTTSDSNDTGLGSSFTAEQLNLNPGTDGAVSLREALLAANTMAGSQTISFNITGTGVHTINVASALPSITSPVVLDATTDDSYAANGNSPAVVLDGNNAFTGDGLVLAAGSGGSSIRGLVIREFDGNGVSVASGSSGNTLLGNLIHSNTGLGIDLGGDGVTANDSGDGDSGANGLQNFPVLATANSTGGNTTLTGSFNSSASTSYRIEFFSSPTGNASGHGEGAVFLGAATATTDGSGNASFALVLTGVSLTAGHVVSATATEDLGGGNYGSTSEYGANVVATNTPAGITVSAVSGNSSEAGGTASFTVVLDTAPTADVTIAVTSSNTREGTVSSALLTFTTANWNLPQTVTVTGVDDSLVDGDRAYTVVLAAASSADAAYNGLNPADVAVSNTDDDTQSTIAVTTTSDTADGDTSSLYALVANPGADGFISLREALSAANNTANGSGGADRIHFAISGTGVHTLTPATALPAISDAVVLDGSTDDSFVANGNRPAVVLDGNNGAFDGLQLTASADGSTIKGLVVRDFGNSGIYVMAGSDNHSIVGNYIGALDTSGLFAAGEGIGGSAVLLAGSGTTIGGATAAERNVVAGAGASGIWIESASGNTVIGNYIGLAADGSTVIGNAWDGVTIANSSNNRIGGTAAGEGNRIAGSGDDGIEVNAGSGGGNALLGNSITGSGSLGIDLGGNNSTPTPNDTGDADTGSNNLQNYPVLATASTNGSTQLAVTGTLNSTANSWFRIEFFSNTSPNSTGYGDGGTYLGFVNVATDGSGNASFSTLLAGVVVPAGSKISATATASNASYNAFAETSEFALNATATLMAPQDLVAVPAVPDAGLLGFYGFSDPDTLGRDDAGGSAPITLVGNPGQTTGPGGSGALDLAGGSSGQYGDIVGLSTGGAMTLAASVRFDSTGSFQRVLDFGTTNSGGIGAFYVSRLNSSNDLTFTIELGGSYTYRATATNAISNGSWLHLAATVDAGGRMALYVNGVQAATANGVAPTEGVRPHNYIGKSNFAVDAAFDGAIDNLVIARGAMTAAQVAALYNQSTGFAVNENAATGAVLGTLVGLDPDASHTLSFSLSDNAGGRFAIDATTGTVTVANGALLDFETTSSHNITAVVTNNDGLSYSESFTISLVDRNDGPSNTVPAAQTTNEDTVRVFSTAGGNAISITDTDAGGANNQVTLSVTNGTLTLSGTAGLSFTSGDGTADSTMTLRGTAAAINAALNGLAFNPTADYNGGAVLSLSSTDSVLLSLDIDTGLVGRYAFENAGNLGQDSSPAAGHPAATVGVTSVVDGSRGPVLGLNGSVNSNLQVSGLMGTPSNVTLAAWVNLTAADTGGSEVISLGDNLILRVDGGTSHNELMGAAFIGGNWVSLVFNTPLAGTGWRHVAFSFDDTGNAAALYLDGQQVAQAVATGSISYSRGTGTTIGTHGNGGPNFNFNGSLDEVRIYNRALSANEVATLARDQAMTRSDTVAITVAAVNDAPVVSTTGTTLSFTENAAATPVDAGITVGDVDSATLVGATASITANYDGAGGDELQFADQNGITGSWNSATGVLTLTGTATVAQYQAALRSVSFVTPSDAPGTGTRTVSFTVNDGTDASAAATRDVAVSAVNDAPVLNTAALTLNEGETVTLALANFGITDPDSGSFTYTVGGVAGGYFQLSSAAGTPVTTFTSADLAAGVVQFVDDGNEVAPAFSVTVNDGGLDSNTLAATISYTPVNDAPVVNSAALTLNEGETVTLATANFGITDPDNANFTYTLSGVAGGYFQLSSAAGTPVTTFTSADLAAGVVQFVDDGNEVAPAFSVTVNDGAFNSNTLAATISYTPVNDAPVVNSAALTLNEGETVTLAPANFGIADPDNASFTYTVSGVVGGYFQLSSSAGTPVTTFTSADLASGVVQFVDDGNEAAPAFSVTLNDGALDSNTLAATITYTPVNDAPVVNTATLTLNEGETVTLAPGNFGITDPDSASFTFTASGVSGGYFQLTSAAGTPVTTFTSADLAAGLVQFVDDGNEVAPAFSITVNDGALDSNTLAATINYTPVNDAPVINSAALTLNEGETVSLAPANFGISDPDSSSFAYTVSGVAGGYFQLSSAAGTPVTTFTSADLAAGLVQFVDDGNEVAPAFSVTVNDGALDSNTLAATISYTPVNDAPVVNSAALTLNEGETVTLAPANFGITDPDSGSFTVTVSGVAGGLFQLSSAAGTPVTTFTSADLAAGLVQFVDDGNEVAPAFSVT